MSCSGIQLFFMRGSTQIIGLPWNSLEVGGGMSEEAEAPMIYSGWHLAAAVPRASRALPRPVMAGTSGVCGRLETLKTSAHRLGQEIESDSTLFPA